MWSMLTLLVVAVTVVGLVAYLLSVAFLLWHARRHVAGIADSLQVVAEHVAPLEEKLVTVNGALSALAEGLATAARHLGRTARVFRP
jgi:hypothetical protein